MNSYQCAVGNVLIKDSLNAMRIVKDINMIFYVISMIHQQQIVVLMDAIKMILRENNGD
jgi:hypothetical protein